MDRSALLQWALEEFGTEPEYLWASHPSYAVLRNSMGQKWYAAVMDVPREKMGLPGEGSAEILNVKCDPLLIGSLRQRPGLLPAYHMNKDRWVSILLDGTVPEEEVQELIQFSHELTLSKKKKR